MCEDETMGCVKMRGGGGGEGFRHTGPSPEQVGV